MGRDREGLLPGPGCQESPFGYTRVTSHPQAWLTADPLQFPRAYPFLPVPQGPEHSKWGVPKPRLPNSSRSDDSSVF